MQIKKFKIKNFRSLEDLEINEFDKTTIFYGENNAGKSNILKALNLIFKRKINFSYDTKESFSLTPPQSFMRGKLLGFGYNYFKNNFKDIYFDVSVSLVKEDFALSAELVFDIFNGDVPDEFTLTIKGYFRSLEDIKNDESEIEINIIQLNGNNIYIFNNKDKTYKYFPLIDSESKENGKFSGYLAELIEPLNDCVQIIDRNRDIKDAKLILDDNLLFNPENFKNYLYNLSLNKSKIHLFERIVKLFNSEPFAFGQINFVLEDGFIEIIIKNGDLYLPISNLGSGVIQTLYIITFVVSNHQKIVCVEELEQNLSPYNQLNVLKKLQSIMRDTEINQLILSSHSPTFADASLGLIYYIEKNEDKTVINEKETNMISRKLFKHLSPSFSSLDLYTPEEFEKSFAEVTRLNEKKFRD